MSIINIKDIKKIQKQAKKHKMEVIFSENKEIITAINNYIENWAWYNNDSFMYELREPNIKEIKEYYVLAGFDVKLEYNDFGNHELLIKW